MPMQLPNNNRAETAQRRALPVAAGTSHCATGQGRCQCLEPTLRQAVALAQEGRGSAAAPRRAAVAERRARGLLESHTAAAAAEAVGRAAAAAPTFCNPIDLPYRFQPTTGESFREGADPTMVVFGGRYLLFLSKNGGYYASNDLVRWSLIVPTGAPDRRLRRHVRDSSTTCPRHVP